MTFIATKKIQTAFSAMILTSILTVASSTMARTPGNDDRNQIEALCEAESSNEVALVSLKRGQPYVEIFKGTRLVKAQFAEKDYSYSGSVLIVSYKTGAVTQGGVSLRIRAYDSDAHNLEGFGHLTMKSGGSFSNSLMSCYVY